MRSRAKKWPAEPFWSRGPLTPDEPYRLNRLKRPYFFSDFFSLLCWRFSRRSSFIGAGACSSRSPSFDTSPPQPQLEASLPQPQLSWPQPQLWQPQLLSQPQPPIHEPPQLPQEACENKWWKQPPNEPPWLPQLPPQSLLLSQQLDSQPPQPPQLPLPPNQ